MANDHDKPAPLVVPEFVAAFLAHAKNLMAFEKGHHRADAPAVVSEPSVSSLTSLVVNEQTKASGGFRRRTEAPAAAVKKFPRPAETERS